MVKTLDDIRARIDEIDKNISTCLKERLACSYEVANLKSKDMNPCIYRKDRENIILGKLTEGLTSEDARVIKEIYKKILIESRSVQYTDAVRNDRVMMYYDKDVIKGECNYNKMICQGIEGAYSSVAANKLADCPIEYVKNFEDVFRSVKDGVIGILPIENSTAGSVGEVYDLLLKYGLYIVKNIELNINHCLLAKKGARMEDIHYVTAHPQALLQCSAFITDNGLNTVSSVNNAVACKTVADGNRFDIAALADRSNAERYNLDIVSDNVTNNRNNATRFIVVADKFVIDNTADKVSIVFSVENKCGTLAEVLNILSAYGVSMSRIESRPIPDEKWDYRFYIDIDGNIGDDNMRALMYQLNSELPFFKVLGCYDTIS